MSAPAGDGELQQQDKETFCTDGVSGGDIIDSPSLHLPVFNLLNDGRHKSCPQHPDGPLEAASRTAHNPPPPPVHVGRWEKVPNKKFQLMLAQVWFQSVIDESGKMTWWLRLL